MGSGGIAWRNNTTNIQIVAAASITNVVPMVTPSTGNGVVFGSGGAALGRGSASTKIAATGMIELPATAPAVGEAVRRDYVDAKPTIISGPAVSTPPDAANYPNNTLFVEFA